MNFFVICLLALNIVPFIITQSIFFDTESDRNRKMPFLFFSVINNVVINGFYLYAAYRKIFHSLVVKKIKEIIAMQCTYQDIQRMANVLVVGLIVAVLLGVFLNIVISRSLLKVAKSKKIIYLMGISVISIPIIFAYKISYSASSYIQISEVCRKTTVTIDGEENEAGSYVDIVNVGVLKNELNRLFLANNEELEESTCFDQRLVIWPGDNYRLIMSDDDSIDLKKDGGSILFLYDDKSEVIDSVMIPALARDESYKLENGNWSVVDNRVEEKVLADPVFSARSGFYEKPFYLSITVPEGEYVYYTLDGSMPAENAQLYTEPIYVYDKSDEENKYKSIINIRRNYYEHTDRGRRSVDKCFVVRAVSVNQNGEKSDVVTYTYFVDKEDYEDAIVLSLVSDPDDLFGEKGIYTTGPDYDAWYEENYPKIVDGEYVDDKEAPLENYMYNGKKWERDANLEIFENKESTLNQEVGIRIQGHSARRSPNKRFSIYARKEYSGSKWFPINQINEYRQHVWLLREGELNAICQKIGSDRDVAVITPQKVKVFLDGEYWYETFLCDKFSENDMAEKYGLTADNISMCKNGRNRSMLDEGITPYSAMYDYIAQNDLSVMENYEQYNTIIDIQSFIDASCMQSILANMDYREKWNNMVWHTVVRENEAEGDTRWRWSLFDMDLAWHTLAEQFGELEPYEINPYQMYGEYQFEGPCTKWKIYNALKSNSEFCKQYVITFMDLINANFSVEHIQSIMDELEITDETIEQFFEKRAEYVVPYMAQEFALQGSLEEVTVSSSEKDKEIRLNTIRVCTNEAWTGKYFTDYPITVSVEDDSFSHWEVVEQGETKVFHTKEIEVPVMEGGIEINAVFK